MGEKMTKNHLDGLNETQSKFVASVVGHQDAYGYIANLFLMSEDVKDKIIKYIGQSLLDSVEMSGDSESFAKTLEDNKDAYGLSDTAQKFILAHRG